MSLFYFSAVLVVDLVNSKILFDLVDILLYETTNNCNKRVSNIIVLLNDKYDNDHAISYYLFWMLLVRACKTCQSMQNNKLISVALV